jgi:hypothetical protein
MNRIDTTGVVQDTFRQGGLSRINMRRDTDIPLKFEAMMILF